MLVSTGSRQGAEMRDAVRDLSIESRISDGSPAALWEFAAKYVEQMSLEERRAGGHVYTPSHLVAFILENAGYHVAAGEQYATLLDPSCGGGAFLVGAVIAIAERLRSSGTQPDRGFGRVLFLRAVEETLWGVDIDANACALAKASVARAVVHVSPGPLPEGFFQANIVQADFLTSSLEDLGQAAKKGFEYIVGNPPYVSATRISASDKSRLRERYLTAGGRLDLYTVFLERSITLLRDGGVLAMVTPDKYLISQSGAALRSFITRHGAVRRIARFQSHKVFADAATVPCVTVVEKGRKPSEFAVLSCAERPGDDGRVRVVRRCTLPPETLAGERWDLVSPRLLGLAREIQTAHPLLGQLAERISAGPATGRDDLFVFPRSGGPAVERELTRPIVRGRDITAYSIQDPGLRILLPYVFDRRTGEGRLVDLKRYPKARAYLGKHRRELEARHCVRVWEKAWYDLHDQALIDLARRSKIVVPDVANSNRFAVDDGRYLPLHSAYYILPHADIDLHFLAAVLNSRVSRFLIRLLAPVVKDGFNRYRRQFLAVLPVPSAPPGIVRQISDAAKHGDLRSADELVTALFALTPGDLVQMDELQGA